VDPTLDAGSYVCSVRGNNGELARREVQLTVNSEYVKRATGLNKNAAVQKIPNVSKIQSYKCSRF
jgi:translation initiation factor 2 gamma subunit (eIF-2gamma)